MGAELQKLQSIHRDIVRLHVQRLDQYAIANELGITPAMVLYTLNSTLGQMAIERLQDQLDARVTDVQSSLATTAKHAQDFLSEVAAGKVDTSYALRAKVCMDQLDRAGFPKVTKNLNLDVHGQLTEAELQDIKQRAFSMKNVIPTEAEAV